MPFINTMNRGVFFPFVERRPCSVTYYDRRMAIRGSWKALAKQADIPNKGGVQTHSADHHRHDTLPKYSKLVDWTELFIIQQFVR